MKKSSKLPKMKVKKPKLPRPLLRSGRQKAVEAKADEALANVPRITNETVAEHREAVLGGARKYIYPLQHSKSRLVRNSVIILIAALVAFLAICGAALYKFQNTSGFMYGVTQVVPFPAAKAGSAWVSCESYLFELRRTMHYYSTQQQADFKNADKALLGRLKKQAMEQVINDAYVKQLAAKNHVSISAAQVNDQVELVRSQNRLGSSQREFTEVLREFWGWSEADFRRELRQQLLAQAVAAKLDTKAQTQAAAAAAELAKGTDFGATAAKYSTDAATRGSGGQYPAPIAPGDPNVPPIVSSTLFKLKPGQVSSILNTGYSLEIVKLISVSGGKATAAHISVTVQPIGTYITPLKAQHPPNRYLKV